MNRPLGISLVLLATVALPGVSAGQADCGDVLSKYRIVVHQMPDGSFALFQKFFFGLHHQPKNHVLLWELESTDGLDNAEITFEQPSPYSASHFVVRPHQPACSGLPVVSEGPKEFRYSIVVHKHGSGTLQQVDPGIIIDRPAMDVSRWQIFVY